MVWTEKNVKSAFAFGNGTMKDFKRFAADNAGNTTCIALDTMTYIDTNKQSKITKTEAHAALEKWHVKTF